MPAFDAALIELGHLLGVFQPDGQVDWRWFGDPPARALAALPAERERIGALIRALLDRGTATGAFIDGTNWEPLLNTAHVDLGLTWTASASPAADPLQLGLGAKAALAVGGQQITLAALARLLQIAGGNITPQLGHAALSGSFPVPSFLTAGTVTADLAPGSVSLGLAATDKAARSSQLDVPNPLLAWDVARLAVFVLRAWISERGATDTFFARLDTHLFPMLGDPPGAIQPFPLVAPMKSAPDFAAWRDSVLSTNNNAAGALTFLWHLRALLTGNESPNFLNGSFFFPLSGAAQAGAAPSLADAAGTYVSPTGTTGAWVGLLTQGATFTLVLDLETAQPPRHCRIPLGRFDGVAFTRPPLDNSWQAIASFIEGTPGFAIGNELLKAVTGPTGVRLSLFRTTVAGSGLAGFDGDYDLAVLLKVGDPPAIVLGTPALDITFPPELNAPDALVGDLVVWAMKAAAPASDLGTLVAAAADFLKKGLAHQPPDAMGLLTAIAGVAGQGHDISVPLGSDAALTLGIANGKVTAGVEFGPIESGDLPFYVGTVKGGVTVNPAVAPFLDGFSLGFENLRLSNASAGSGIVASLIPDMRQMPGFHLAVEFAASKLRVSGGGKIPIQRTIGPLEIAALLIDIREESFSVGLDLGFQLAAISVAAYELGLKVNFADGSVEPFLHGLALSMDTGAVKLAGFFGEVDNAGQKDYVGGAVVSIAGYFELSAIGGYTQLPDHSTSLFIFASLVAPLGGPPWFFITGVAGGFGYNRSLPAPGLLLEHPFLKVMRGEIPMGGDAIEAIKGLSVYFAAMKDQHWVAAGIQFTAFGFINGKVVVAIGFGKKFSITILGMASFGIKPIAYFEIGIEATADEEKFLLRARLSPNSYVIHPDIFSLQGDFALGAWYKEPHKGDFLFSIGGYHPLYQKPEHYPELIRVGCKATVYGFVHLSVEVFFACTPQALMAGAKASLWAEFAGISAGLDVYVDVLMKWDPFFLRARLGVHVWFEFCGRHEIGVDLDIWTPDFGGIATIDLMIVSFDVAFGADLAAPPPPSIAEFLTKQIGVDATAWNGNGARVPAFSTDKGAGLFRVEFLSGRAGKAPPSKDDQQEGLDAAAPVRLSAEWSFLLRTRLPIGSLDTSLPPAPSFAGQVDLPLCNVFDRESTLTLAAARIADAQRTWLADYFPAANFGDKMPDAKASAADVATSLKGKAPSLALVEGVVVEYAPTIPAATDLNAPSGEQSDAEDTYPLPLGAAQSGLSHGAVKEKYRFTGITNLTVHTASGVDRRAAALADLRGRKRRPFDLRLRTAELQRSTSLMSGRSFTVAASMAALPTMAPPPSPTRPAEMCAVQLKTLATRSNEAAGLRRRQMETLTPPRAFREQRIAPTGEGRDSYQTMLRVPAGQAAQLVFEDGRPAKAQLTVAGDQTLRVVMLDRGGAVLRDGYVRGSTAAVIPPAAVQALVVGEGLTQQPATAGFERDSILLAATSRQFIGHGCVVDALSNLDLNVQPLDSLPGAELFDRVSTLRVSFTSAPREDGTLVLKLVPAVDRPAPAAEQVRWRADGALLRGVIPVISSGRVALVMSVRSSAAWSLDIDLGPEWRLDGVAVLPRNARVVTTELATHASWDLVDDAMPVHPRGLNSAVTLEARA